MADSISWITKEGIEIYSIHWPTNQAKAVIGIIHGLGEHIHRYEHVAQFFNDKGYAVLGYDRQGHGRSKGKRGHTLNGLKAYLDEIGQLQKHMNDAYPDLPMFLYGHSMGGNLGLNYIIRRQPSIKGAIMTGPHITLSFTPPAVEVAMGKLMRKIYPSYTQANGLDVKALSRDENVVKAYLDDPLVHNRITAATAIGLLESAAFLDEYQQEINTPLLLMHGAADRITNPDGTKRFAERVPGNIELKIWEDFFHEIHNEPEQETVLQFALAWLEKTLA